MPLFPASNSQLFPLSVGDRISAPVSPRRHSVRVFAHVSLRMLFSQDRMTANGNSPLDSMRTLEHYLSDIMRTGAADTPEHVKGKCPGLGPR